uniref:LAGLIDADG_2 domain-containing protein n=1 Tax=Heterorhabditis bacteriophora TaxID=37862 RepID=A0A1I7WNN3_HETBA
MIYIYIYSFFIMSWEEERFLRYGGMQSDIDEDELKRDFSLQKGKRNSGLDQEMLSLILVYLMIFFSIKKKITRIRWVDFIMYLVLWVFFNEITLKYIYIYIYNLGNLKTYIKTYSGHCNNVNQPLQGAVYEPLKRLINPDYFDRNFMIYLIDQKLNFKTMSGVSAPRRAASSAFLPSAGKVASLFTQYITPSFLDLSKYRYHVATRHWITPNVLVLTFLKEMVSGYIDGSQIYGSTTDIANKMRSFEDGKLIFQILGGKNAVEACKSVCSILARISRRLHKMGKIRKHGKWVPYKLSEKSIGRRLNICISLLARQLLLCIWWDTKRVLFCELLQPDVIESEGKYFDD